MVAVTAQAVDNTDDGVDARTSLDFDEWLVCLGLCGHIKYEEVEEMSLAQRVEGLISNYLKGEGPGWGDEHDVITKAVVEPIMRFDPSYATPTGGQPKDEFQVHSYSPATLLYISLCTLHPLTVPPPRP